MGLYTKMIDRQKLHQAWQRVKQNKPAAGVDNVTWEEFDAGQKENLGQLYLELSQHTYQSLPVKMVPLYRGEKKRDISLYLMRDKVVQQSIAAELNKLYDSTFSHAVYAYRSGRSAMKAAEFLEAKLKLEGNDWILRADIKSFFNSVQLEKLYAMLAKNIREQDVLDLIRCCCEAPQLKKDGSLKPKMLGIYQGSGIAPVLSNIYLQELDQAMEGKCRVYIRYSDDILVLGESREELEQMRDFLQLQLELLGLTFSEEKTIIQSAEEGGGFPWIPIDERGESDSDDGGEEFAGAPRSDLDRRHTAGGEADEGRGGAERMGAVLSEGAGDRKY